MFLRTSDYNEGTCLAGHVHVPSNVLLQWQYVISDMWHIHWVINFRYLFTYKRRNNCFWSECVWSSHLVVKSNSFAYFLISPYKTSFMDPNGCDCESSSTYFFIAPRWPHLVGYACKIWIASLVLPSESSFSQSVGYHRLHKTILCYYSTLLESMCIRLSKTKHTTTVICGRYKPKPQG